LSINFTH